MLRRSPLVSNWCRGTSTLLFSTVLFAASARTQVDAATKVDRKEAFIGYSEQKVARSALGCKDSDQQCSKWAGDNECLLNPGFMRSTCVKSCHVAFACGDDFLKSPPLTGYATTEETKAFSSRFPGLSTHPPAATHFRYDPSMSDYLTGSSQGIRSRPWLSLSSMGVGLYLGSEDAETDEQVVSALLKSVARGWNVIDTARNYRRGRAEAAVGEALMTLTRQGLRREQLFISTKAGYLPADSVQELLKSGKIRAADVQSGSCVHPACLKSSLTQSLAAMHLGTVDLLYLHNAAESHLLDDNRKDFMQKIRDAFRQMEEFRKEGRIRAYGMATWDSLRRPPEDPRHVSLQELVDIAHAEGGINHGFRYVQLPINAAMREAWEPSWQTVRARGAPSDEPASLKLPVTAAAAQLGLGVFASGPLGEGSLLDDRQRLDRLGEFPQLRHVRGDGAKLLQLARSTPYVICAVVGQKTSSHVDENLALTQVDLLSPALFRQVFEQLDAFDGDAVDPDEAKDGDEPQLTPDELAAGPSAGATER